MQNFINSNHPAKGIPRVYTQEVLAWISLCINGWTKLIQIRRKHHNIGNNFLKQWKSLFTSRVVIFVNFILIVNSDLIILHSLT
jgi:hypothetical protein